MFFGPRTLDQENVRMHALTLNAANAKIFTYEKEKQILNELYDFMRHSLSYPQRVTAVKESWPSWPK